MRKSLVVVFSLAIATAILTMGICSPDSIGKRDLEKIRGGVCKKTCQTNSLCDGEAAACDGNCTGAAQGTSCGWDNLETVQAWYCGPEIAGGGGCNLSAQQTMKGYLCKCNNNSVCEAEASWQNCQYYSSCGVD